MLEIGSMVGPYKILNEIGRGGMSVVYMAINEKANKTWAIKEIRKDGTINSQEIKQKLVVQEIEILKQLHHPRLPSIVNILDRDDTYLIIMDYIEGNSLNKVLEENGPLPQEEVVEWAKQLCDVLIYLHKPIPEKGEPKIKPKIIYRDMKPANIMLKPDNTVTLIDFGTAREYKNKNQTADTIIACTQGYAAPEQSGGQGQTDERTDIYGLGTTMYHLLTGEYPKSKPPYTIQPITKINPNLSLGLEQIILKCTQDDPNQRYQTVEDLLFDLNHYPIIDVKNEKRRAKKLNWFIATAAMSLAFVIAGIGFQFTARKKANNTYLVKLDEAAKAVQYETKVNLYKECIEIPNKAGEKEAYLGLLKTFKEDDSVFSLTEAQQIEKLIRNHKQELQVQPDNYTQICFEMGKMFWYYYDYGNGTDNQVTKAKSSIEWFQDVIENAPENFKNLGMAKVYANIGLFYRDITTNITEANDKGKYAPLFQNLNELITTVAQNEEENEIVRLEMLELSRSALQQYATKFKNDGLLQSDLDKMFVAIESTLQEIQPTTDTTEQKKNKTAALLEDTKAAITTAYATKKGGK